MRDFNDLCVAVAAGSRTEAETALQDAATTSLVERLASETYGLDFAQTRLQERRLWGSRESYVREHVIDMTTWLRDTYRVRFGS